MKTLLEGIIEGFVREAPKKERQPGETWQTDKGWAAKSMDTSIEKPEYGFKDEPSAKAWATGRGPAPDDASGEQPAGAEDDPQAGQQSPDDAIASDPALAALNRQAAQGESPPEEKPDEEPEADSQIKRQRQVDRQQVIETLRSTKESLAQKEKERLSLRESIVSALKEKFGSSRWASKARASGETLTLVGVTGTEESKLATEWVDDADSLESSNVGLGTDASRAGESAVVYGLQQLVEQSTDPNFNLQSAMDSLQKELTELASSKGTLLDKSWVSAGMKTIQSLVDRYGLENIQEVAWDTVEGNELIGSTGHGTSADMFLKLKNGDRVGVSLKKDFNVFFMNGGLATTLKSIMGDLSEESRQFIGDRLSINAYVKERRKRFQELQNDASFRKKAIKFYKDCKKNGNCGNLEKKDIVSRLDKLESALNNDSEKLSGDEMKILARVADNVGSHEHIKNLRNLDNDYATEIFNIAQENEEFGNLLKKKVIHGLHITDTLGIGLDGLDEFATSFGGSNLTKENIADYFLVTDGDKKELAQLLKRKDSKGVMKFFMDRIDLSLDQQKGSPLIRFKRSSEKEDGRAQWLTLSEASVRARGLGEAPTFELGTSNELKYIIEHGGNMMTWPEKVKNAFNKIRRTQESAPPELRKLIRDIALWKLGNYGN
jgi:hypothetical protein